MTYWYDRTHDPRPWMPGDRQCRCGTALDHPIHGTPRMDWRIVLEAGIAFVFIVAVVVVASVGYAP